MVARKQKNYIIKQCLSDEIANHIKASIFALHFQPGQRLLVDKIAELYNVSRTPVRDGLVSLVEQGLVDYNGFCYTVFSPSEQNIRDLFEIRATLERLSVRQATQKMETEQIQYLKNLYAGKDTLKEHEELSDLVELDIKFHDGILHGAQNTRLKKLLSVVREQCWLIRRWGFGNEEVCIEQKTIEEHVAIIEAMLKREADDAATYMYIHLQNSQKRIMELTNIKRLLVRNI